MPATVSAYHPQCVRSPHAPDRLQHETDVMFSALLLGAALTPGQVTTTPTSPPGADSSPAMVALTPPNGYDCAACDAKTKDPGGFCKRFFDAYCKKEEPSDPNAPPPE